jgi:hypothetical protein
MKVKFHKIAKSGVFFSQNLGAVLYSRTKNLDKKGGISTSLPNQNDAEPENATAPTSTITGILDPQSHS